MNNERKLQAITFDVNNGQTLQFAQSSHDGLVMVSRKQPNGKTEAAELIPPGQFVMLWNLYRYIMDNNVRNDFINPNGRNEV